MPDIEPLTRFEAIASGEDEQPLTRAESILAGEDVEPITRFEYFLKMAASSGGSVEIESGTYTQESIAAQLNIPFENEHSRIPDMYMVCWSSKNSGGVTNGALSFVFGFFDNVFGAIDLGTSTTLDLHGSVVFQYKTSSGNYTASLANYLLYGENSFDTSKYAAKTYCTKEKLTPIYPSGSTTRNFYDGKYDWIALWLPTLNTDSGRA